MDTSTLLALILATAIGGIAAFPLSRALKLRYLMARPARRSTASDPTRVVMDLLSYAEAARRGGHNSLASLLPGVRDPLVSKALSLAVGGASEPALRRALERDPAAGSAHRDWLRREGFCLAALVAALIASLALVAKVSSGDLAGTTASGLVLCALYGSMMLSTVGARRSTTDIASQLLTREIVIAGALAVRDGIDPTLLRTRLLSMLPDEASRAEPIARAA